MILFKEDWKKHPTAIPNYDTKNRSWVHIAGVLYKMGIENCLFLLALHNPELKDIDPFDPKLTKEQINAIVVEAKENPWYVLRELIRIPPLSGTDPVMLRANRANIALWWSFFNHVTTMLIQPRQTGKSVSADALMVTILSVMSVNTDIQLLTKDDKLRVKNVERVKNIIDNLPYYFKLRTRHDTNNTEKITVKALGNNYLTAVAQASEKAALNLGRGMTTGVNQIDEIAFINNIGTTLSAMLAASTAAREEARNNNAPYGNFFTTTPGYLSNPSGAFAYSLYTDGMKFTEKLYDAKDEEDLYSIIKKNVRNGRVMLILDFNHRQLGYTDEWLKERISSSLVSSDKVGPEFLNLWSEGTNESPIRKDLLKIITKSVIPDPYIEISKYGYVTRWYVSEDEVNYGLKGRYLILNVDSSDAVGKDDIGVVIRDSKTGEVLASGNYNETNLVTFSEWLMDWLTRFDNLVMVIERRSSGVMIIDNLLKLSVALGIDPFKRLFNWVVNDSSINAKYRNEITDIPFNKRDMVVYERYRDKFGFATSGGGRTSRTMLYGDVFNASVKYTGNTVRDKVLIDQLSGLTIKNNRIDHRDGGHDDLVIAWLLGYWFLSKAENKEYYGLDPRNVLTTVIDNMIAEQGGSDAIEHKNKQLKIKQEIEHYLELIRHEHNKIRSNMYMMKIKMLHKYLDNDIAQNLNIEAVLDNIRIEKMKKV